MNSNIRKKYNTKKILAIIITIVFFVFMLYWILFFYFEYKHKDEKIIYFSSNASLIDMYFVCKSGGAKLRNFSYGDSCESAKSGIGFTSVFWDCDCGNDKCWNGKKCETNPKKSNFLLE